MLKRMGGLVCENQRPLGRYADVGVQLSSTVCDSAAIPSQILRRSSGGKRGKRVNSSSDLSGV